MGSASSRSWCRAWDEASDGLLHALSEARPLDASVRSCIEQRQRLTNANLRGKGPDRVPEEEQRAWLERAVEREGAIRRAYVRYCEIVRQSVYGHRSGARVRATFGDKLESRPTRIYRKV